MIATRAAAGALALAMASHGAHAQQGQARPQAQATDTAQAATPASGTPLVRLLRAMEAAAPSLRSDPPPDVAAMGAAGPMPERARDVLERAAANPSFEAVDAIVASAAAWEAWLRSAGRATFVLFGVPDPSRREAALFAAHELAILAAASSAIIDRAIERADAAGAQAGAEVDGQIERAVHARQVVLPLQAARAALVVASLAEPAAARAALALEAGETARRVPGVSAWAECERRLVSALARVLEGRPELAEAEIDAAIAGARARDAAAELRDRTAAEAAFVRALAVLGARGPISARESLERAWAAPPMAAREPGQPRDTALGLVGADLFVRLSRAEAARLSGEERSRALFRAYERYADLLEHLPPSRRAVVYAHLSRLVPSELEAGTPTVAAVSRGVGLMLERRSADAASALARVVARGGTGPMDADAQHLLAAAHADAGAHAQAVDAALALADRFEHDARVGQALSMAARSASLWTRETGALGAGGEPSEALRRFAEVVERFDGRDDVPDADAWRIALAQDRVPTTGAMSTAQLGEAARESLRLLGRVRSASHGDEAARARVDVLARAMSRSRELERADLNAGALSREHAQALLDALDALGRDASDAEEDLRRALRGRALVVLDRPADALAAVAPVLAREQAAADVRASALATSMEAALAQGDLAAARDAATKLDAISTDQEAKAPSAGAVLAQRSDRLWLIVRPETEGFVADRGGAAPKLDMPTFTLAHERSPEGATARERLAWALLLSGDANASADVFERALEGARRSDLLRGLGEARLAAGDQERAFAAFREAAAGLAGAGIDNRDTWHAWTRMLEILSRRPDAAERGPSIRREVARLRSLASAAQHPDCLARLDEVEARLAAAGNASGK